MKNIAIITARGGSKRIPKKNIKDFLGKPLIAYSIEAALSLDIFDEVMVSTDDREIAEISKKYGAKIPFFRSTKNADDYSTTSDVLLEVIDCYEKKDIYFDNLCCIYPTAPFLTGEKIGSAYEQLKESNYDVVMTVCAFDYPIQRALRISKNSKKLEFADPKFENIRSQDIESMYHDVGQLYWSKIPEFKLSKTMFSSNTSGFIVSDMEAQDIDTLNDWKIAEMKYQLFSQK